MESRDSFAITLKALREKAGLTQPALAKAAGLSKQTVSQLEMGKREPSWSTVQELAKALGVDCRAFQDQGPRTAPGPRFEAGGTARRKGKKKG